jgi:hypothetical protein
MNIRLKFIIEIFSAPSETYFIQSDLLKSYVVGKCWVIGEEGILNIATATSIRIRKVRKKE